MSASTSVTLSVEGEGARVQHESDARARTALLLIGRIGIAALPKQAYLASIYLYEAERGTDGRCLAGAVCAHKANNLAGLYGKCDIAQRKRLLTRRETALSSNRFCMV